MNVKFLRMISLVLIVTSTSCAPQATPTPVDVIGTTAAQLAMMMLTQTAGAATATPTVTLTLPPTETATLPPPTEEGKRQPPVVTSFVPCFTGPDESYKFISNIDPSIRRSNKQVVEILGTGSVPGWIVIRNPYFNNPCWVRQENMEIGAHIILADYPVMTPGPMP